MPVELRHCIIIIIIIIIIILIKTTSITYVEIMIDDSVVHYLPQSKACIKSLFV